MNIHIYLIFANETQNSPIVKALIASGNDTRAISSRVRLNYSNKFLSYLIGLPHLMLFSFKAAFFTFRHSKSVDSVVVNSHFDIMFLTIMFWFYGRKPKIIYPGFIYTQRYNDFIQGIKYKYYRWILSNSDVIVCHSKFEVEENKCIFPNIKSCFFFMPYAHHVNGATGFQSESIFSKKILSAGRSGRDYPTLINAIKNTDTSLQIITDGQVTTDGSATLSKQVEVVRGCYGGDYYARIKQARIVVIPLKDDDISAGQMVMLDAMAMGKPVVITKTHTTTEYFEENCGILLVEKGDIASMQRIITRLMKDDAFCSAMGKASAKTYDKKHTIKAYANGLSEAAEFAARH